LAFKQRTRQVVNALSTINFIWDIFTLTVIDLYGFLVLFVKC